MVPGRPPWVPGRTKPLTGRPDCEVGLSKQIYLLHLLARARHWKWADLRYSHFRVKQALPFCWKQNCVIKFLCTLCFLFFSYNFTWLLIAFLRCFNWCRQTSCLCARNWNKHFAGRSILCFGDGRIFRLKSSDRTPWLGAPAAVPGTLNEVPGLATWAMELSSISISAIPSSSTSISSTYTCSVRALVFNVHAAFQKTSPWQAAQRQPVNEERAVRAILKWTQQSDLVHQWISFQH